MSPLLLFPLLQVTTAPTILELPDPRATTIHVEALIRIPELDAQEMAAAQVLARTLAEETGDYIRHQLILYGGQTGIRPRVAVMPDHIRIRVVMPSGQMSLAASITESLIRRPLFPEEPVLQAIERLPFQSRSPWEEALSPFLPLYSRIRRQDVVTFHRRYFRPENLTIAVAGGFGGASPRDELMKRFEGWQPQRLISLLDPLPARPLQTRQQAVSTLELRGRHIPANSPELPAQLAALFALGVGKSSTVYSVFRESESWSYRQEALLWPAGDGFVPRVLLAFQADEAEGERPAAAIDLLKAAIEAWNFEDRDRAIAMAETVLLHGLELEPWRFTLMPPANEPLERSTFMTAYWHMKTGKAFDAHELLKGMRDTTVDELRQAALDMFAQPRTRLIAGRRD
jgi:hypothetical protein